MQFRVFHIPLRSAEEATQEMSRFLRAHRILAVEKRVREEDGGGWGFRVEYMSSGSWLTLPNASVTGDGREIFLSNDVGSAHDLFFATRASPSDPWGTPQLVGAPVNTPYAEFLGPWISADNLILLWSDGWSRGSNPVPGGHGGSDLRTGKCKHHVV